MSATNKVQVRSSLRSFASFLSVSHHVFYCVAAVCGDGAGESKEIRTAISYAQAR